MQVKKQQLELDMEQQTDSKLGKEHVNTVYCHTNTTPPCSAVVDEFCKILLSLSFVTLRTIFLYILNTHMLYMCILYRYASNVLFH